MSIQLVGKFGFLSIFSAGAESEYAELLDLIMALSKKDKSQ